MKATIDIVAGGRVNIGGNVYPIDEIKVRPVGASQGQVVWPTANTALTYQIVSYRVAYSSGSIILANGGNYAYCVGDVKVFRDGIEVQTLCS